MIVQSTQGGVDIYDEADTQSVKLNDSKIPNGTAIHVLGEKNGVDNKKWAYTPVSYTHLDVYKRQVICLPAGQRIPAMNTDILKLKTELWQKVSRHWMERNTTLIQAAARWL